ncbi:MAG: exodeoxyribonuclease VII large subunit [Thiomargarita sp.]|nr:exodeoxyribonuclease VII large subunit [Thiomargarita sp.]
MIAEEPIFVNCSFVEKDQIKKLGAKFDWQRKKWFIPVGLETEAFNQWLPITDKLLNQESLTLHNLLSNVQTTLLDKYDTYYWVRAEIVHITTNFHVYLELSDYDGQANEIAKVRATLWKNKAAELIQQFETQTGMVLKAGLKVLLQVQVEFHTLYGFSLNIINLDPSFTMGEMEAKLNKIRLALKEIYQHNRIIKQPSDFCKVAVIAPQNAAGLGDFKSQADVLQKLELCEFKYYSASFQGKQLITDISAVFKRIGQVHKQFDAIVMIRGGGAKADLFQLNEYEVVKAVCASPLPVIVGIGHERDQTLLDEVANYSCHTPSLVISYIASIIIQNAQYANQNWQLFNQTAKSLLNQAKIQNERLLMQIREQNIKQLHNQQQNLAHLMQAIKNDCKSQLQQAKYQIKSLMKQILLTDPKTILNQGYAIVRTEKDKLITSQINAKKANYLTIEFKDGKVDCCIKE